MSPKRVAYLTALPKAGILQGLLARLVVSVALIVLTGLNSVVFAAVPMRFVYPPPENASDQRQTHSALETRLRPIRLPLGKGLLGCRVFLILADTQARLDQVQTLDDLKKFSIGQRPSWTDT